MRDARAQGTGYRVGMINKLKNQIDAIEGLKGKSSAGSPDFVLWRKETEELLIEIFGLDSSEVQDFNAIYFTPVFLTCRMSDEAFDEAYRNGLEEAREFLLSMMGKIRRPG